MAGRPSTIEFLEISTGRLWCKKWLYCQEQEVSWSINSWSSKSAFRWLNCVSREYGTEKFGLWMPVMNVNSVSWLKEWNTILYLKYQAYGHQVVPWYTVSWSCWAKAGFEAPLSRRIPGRCPLNEGCILTKIAARGRQRLGHRQCTPGAPWNMCECFQSPDSLKITSQRKSGNANQAWCEGVDSIMSMRWYRERRQTSR